MNYPGRKELAYYLVGLYGLNGGLPDERFVRTLHRLYGARYTRDIVFPKVMDLLYRVRYNYTPCESTRLIAVIPNLHRGNTGDIVPVLQTDQWYVVHDGVEGGLFRTLYVATWTAELATMERPNQGLSFPVRWCVGVAPTARQRLLRSQHVHDQLLAGIPIRRMEDPGVLPDPGVTHADVINTFV
jgi:hypothetical protein